MQKKIAKKIESPSPKRSGDIPVTVRHLELVKQELKNQITGVDLKMQAGFSEIKSSIFRLEALFEEQNSRNRIVLDGHSSLNDKQLSTEDRVEKLEIKVFGVVQK